MRKKLLTLLLYVYAAVATLASVPLMLLIGPAAEVANGTSVRILGAALFSLGVGAIAAARDPERNRSLLAVETIFTALVTLVLVFKVVIHRSHAGFDERVYLVLAPTLVCLVLLLTTFPHGRHGYTERDSGSPRGEEPHGEG